MTYQKSEKSHARLDEKSRVKKANKILTVLGQEVDLSKAKVLDIGTGNGKIISLISKSCGEAISVDLLDERVAKDGYDFKIVKNEKLPFEDNSFDVVITNHVIEHVPNQKLHMEEITRVLKKGGVVYLATPNKYWLTDPHYKLPLLSWFPRKISAMYLKLVQGKEWDIYPQSYGMLKKLTKKSFSIENYAVKIIKDPKKYDLDVMKMIQPIVKFIPKFLLNSMASILPTHILVLRKNSE